jgi:hypothetical protein
MNRFHMLLLASAMLLSFGSNVVLAQYPGDDVYDYDYDYYPTDKDIDVIEINKRFLTPLYKPEPKKERNNGTLVNALGAKKKPRKKQNAKASDVANARYRFCGLVARQKALVASMRQPGGNITGFSYFDFSLGGKWLDLLKGAAPGLAPVAVMFNPDTSPYFMSFMQEAEAAAPSLGVQVIAAPIRAAADIEPAFAHIARQPNGGLMLMASSFTRLHLKLIADLAGRNRLPSIGSDTGFTQAGGLMEYNPDIDKVGQYRQAATYVDRILKGLKPGDLPVQAADRYRLVINLKTAKALGLTIPETLLATADEVIQ